jgi:hypothetical protein
MVTAAGRGAGLMAATTVSRPRPADGGSIRLRSEGTKTFGYAFLAHTVISGIYATSTASLGQRLYPKLKFAQFASAAGLLNAACYALLPPMMRLILDASGHNYRLTFLSSGILATLGLGMLIVVHQKFLKLGGTRNYVAPHAQPLEGVGI